MRAVRSGMPTTGRPGGARATDRCTFSAFSWPEVGDHGQLLDHPQPHGERAPPGSTIGSVSTIAPADDPATTAPSPA